jgi:hypothetical protein
MGLLLCAALLLGAEFSKVYKRTWNSKAPGNLEVSLARRPGGTGFCMTVEIGIGELE